MNFDLIRRWTLWVLCGLSIHLLWQQLILIMNRVLKILSIYSPNQQNVHTYLATGKFNWNISMSCFIDAHPMNIIFFWVLSIKRKIIGRITCLKVNQTSLFYEINFLMLFQFSLTDAISSIYICECYLIFGCSKQCIMIGT